MNTKKEFVLFSMTKHFAVSCKVWTCTTLLLVIIIIVTVVLMSLEVSLIQRDSSKRKCGWSANRPRHVVRVKGQLTPTSSSPALLHTGSLNQRANTHQLACAHALRRAQRGKNSWLFLRGWPNNSPFAWSTFSAQWWPAPGTRKHRPPRVRWGLH